MVELTTAGAGQLRFLRPANTRPPNHLIAGKALIAGVNCVGGTVALQPHSTTNCIKMPVRFIPGDKFVHA